LALDFGKVAVKGLGLGGLFGMKGSSDNASENCCKFSKLRAFSRNTFRFQNVIAGSCENLHKPTGNN